MSGALFGGLSLRRAAVVAVFLAVCSLEATSPCAWGATGCAFCGQCFACDEEIGKCFGSVVWEGAGPVPNCHMCPFCRFCALCTVISVVCRYWMAVLAPIFTLCFRPNRYVAMAVFCVCFGVAGLWATVSVLRTPVLEAADKTLFNFDFPATATKPEVCELEQNSCLVVVLGTSGRTGNCFVALFNALEMVYKCGGVIEPKNFEFVHMKMPHLVNPRNYNLNQLDFALKNCKRRYMEWDAFFHRFSVDNCTCYAGKEFTGVMLEDFLPVRPEFLQMNLSDATVAHFRGGDSFTKGPMDSYDQPPCSYYETAINHAQSRQLVFVAEDDSNPCVAAMQFKYPNATVLKQEASPAEAFFVMLRAAVLVVSHSSFSSVAAFAGTKHKRLYLTSHDREREWLDFTPAMGRHFSRQILTVCRIGYDATMLRPWRADQQQIALLSSLHSSAPVCQK